jgi:hypothetical protein
MTWPSLHALINHFPIVLAVIGGLAVLLAAMIERRAIWMYALCTLTLAGLTIYPAWWTGERANGVVRKAWYIAPDAIHSHSAAADITLWIVGVTGALALISLITLVRTREALSPAKGFRVLVGLGALASFCAVGYTGYLGGKVVIDSPILASPTPPVISVPASAPNSVSPTTQSSSPGATPQTASPAQVAQPQTNLQQPTQPQPQPQTTVPKPQTP